MMRVAELWRARTSPAREGASAPAVTTPARGARGGKGKSRSQRREEERDARRAASASAVVRWRALGSAQANHPLHGEVPNEVKLNDWGERNYRGRVAMYEDWHCLWASTHRVRS